MKKIIILGVIVLFVGSCFQPAFANENKTSNEILTIDTENENTEQFSKWYPEFKQRIEELENRFFSVGDEKERMVILEKIAMTYDEYGLLPDGMNVDEMVEYMVDSRSSRDYYGDKIIQKQKYVPGELIVKFKNEISLSVSSNGILITGSELIDKLKEDYGVISIEKLFKSNAPTSFSNVYKFVFSDGKDVLDFLGKHNSDPNIKYAELNYISTFSKEKQDINPSNFPDDPYFDQQWGLHNTGQTGGTSDADIDAPEAWDIETGDSDVTIAILDSGIDYNHQDLLDNIWFNEDEIPNNHIDDDINGFVDDIRGWDFYDENNDPMDINGHGTHCAGIAGAVGNNGIGIVGVCWNCKIMPIRLGNHGVYADAAAQGIIYAADNGADVISMSWGSTVRSNLIRDALEYAYAKDVVLVAAAGNGKNFKRHFPAGIDNVISVAATDSNDEKANFSNYGEWVDVAAPGINILSLRANNTDMYGDGTHIVDEYYYIADGTSMSGPFVAGLAGLLLSKYSECPYPVQMVDSMIPFTTDDVDFVLGRGRINAYKALDSFPFAATLEGMTKWEDTKGTVDINGTVWSEDFLYYVLEYGIGDHPTTWIEMSSSPTPRQGILYSWDTTLVHDGLYTVRLRIISNHGEYSDETNIYVNNEADGTYEADIYVSNCYDSSTPGLGITRFDNINDAINKSKIFDTIFVYDGFYTENLLFSGLTNSFINLVGQSKDYTIIDGSIVIMNAIKVTVSGFNLGFKTDKHDFTSMGYWEYAVGLFQSTLCTISENTFLGNFGEGCVVIRICSRIDFKDNIILGATYLDDISMDISSKIEISGNENLGWVLIWFFCHSNIIKSNIFNGVEAGAVVIWNSWNNLVYKNKISNTSSVGISLIDTSFANKIYANSISDCYWGIVYSEILSTSIGRNQIYLNNFIRNEVSNAIDEGANLWHNLILGKGNYWDDYTGVDNNGDGIGDTPYMISNWDGSGYNKDRFPLMEPVDTDNVTIAFDLSKTFTDTRPQNKVTNNVLLLRILERFPLLERLYYLLN